MSIRDQIDQSDQKIAWAKHSNDESEPCEHNRSDKEDLYKYDDEIDVCN